MRSINPNESELGLTRIENLVQIDSSDQVGLFFHRFSDWFGNRLHNNSDSFRLNSLLWNSNGYRALYGIYKNKMSIGSYVGSHIGSSLIFLLERIWGRFRHRILRRFSYRIVYKFLHRFLCRFRHRNLYSEIQVVSYLILNKNWGLKSS